MSAANSEARKRGDERRVFDELVERRRAVKARVEAARIERRREVAQQALEAVWSGADFADADAVLDQLADRGWTISEVRL